MRITSRLPAPAGQQFGPRAFQGQIGELFTLEKLDGSLTAGIIVDAVVSDDGMSVALTMDVPDL
jgi:hypothetical protein